MQIVHYGNPSASTVLIQPVGDHDLEEMETELNEIRKQGKADFQLIAVKVDNWNRDLSPWEASADFRRGVLPWKRCGAYGERAGSGGDGTSCTEGLGTFLSGGQQTACGGRKHGAAGAI